MIAKSLLIGFIAFDGAAIGIGNAFSVQDPVAGPVYGNRNFSGFKTAAGSYQLRIGGPVLTASSAPPWAANEWSRGLGNQKISVVLYGAAGPVFSLSYALFRVDDNTWNLDTYWALPPGLTPVLNDSFVQFSVETLAT